MVVVVVFLLLVVMVVVASSEKKATSKWPLNSNKRRMKKTHTGTRLRKFPITRSSQRTRGEARGKLCAGLIPLTYRSGNRQRPPHGVRCKPLDEVARRLRAAPPRRQLRKKWKTGQGEQHVDQVIQHSRAQLTICGHAANENGQQAPPPFVALAHARPEFQIAGAGGV